MFGLGWQEILVILVIAVLVIGPEQLPQVARTIGKMMAQFRRATNDLRESINKEFSESEDLKDFKEFSQSIDSEVRTIGYTAQDYVEREIAKEEEELRKLEKEVEATAGDPGPLTDPEPVPTAAPEEEPVSVTATVPDVAPDEPAAEEKEAPAESAGPRKETA